MNPMDRIRVIKARHFIRCMDFYLWLYGRYRFGTAAQRLVTAMSRAVAGALPFVLKVDLLHRCNLRCAMCYAEHDAAMMPLDDFKRLIAPLAGIGCRLDLMGGEPFLYPHLAEAIASARATIRCREVIVYTNGTAITPEKAKAAQSAGLTGAMVNLASHDEAKHDRFTGVAGSWRETLRGIAALKEAGVETAAFIVLHRDNIADVEAMIRFADERLGVAPVFFQYVPRRAGDPLVPSRDDWDRAKRRVLYGDERGRAHAATIARLMTLCGRDCLGGYYSFSVKTNGDVTPCPFIHDLVLGNALDEGIWRVFLKRFDTARFRDFSAIPADCRAGNGDYGSRDVRCRGPWQEPMDHDRLFERLPTFF